MLSVYDYRRLTKVTRKKLFARESALPPDLWERVESIAQSVRTKGDSALKALTEKFDGVRLKDFHPEKALWDHALSTIDPKLKEAIIIAQKNIKTFHQESMHITPKRVETFPGVVCEKRFLPIESVGIYIPGGTSPLFSTALMTVIPAQIAGCEHIYITTPPNPAPEILATLQLLGISRKQVFTLGGAQAIFALAYGTESVPEVEKIVGPGNAFVTAAKIMISKEKAIDMPAGPSEVMVVADNKADIDFIIADLCSQAEHGKDSQSVLVAPQEVTKNVKERLPKIVSRLPRQHFLTASLKNSFALIAESTTEILEIINDYAPEHLILNTEEAEALLPKIKNAGSVFIGPWSCESFGDYASGTNHVLPTAGWAKRVSGLSVESFLKSITYQRIHPRAVMPLGDIVITMAEKEDLPSHAFAVKVRQEALKRKTS